MPFEAFVHYYESVHAKLVDIGAPNAKRYFRKYLRPINGKEGAVDVVVEIWFDDKSARDSSPAMSDPAVMKRILEDEVNLFATDSIVGFTYEEKETAF